MLVARKADALIEAGGGAGEERMRLRGVPLEAFSTVYKICTALAGYEGEMWDQLTTQAAEDEVLSLRDVRGRTVMHWAAQDDSRMKLVKVMAAWDAGLVNAKDIIGGTPLHRAARHGQAAVAVALLAVGADKDAKDRNGLTALHWAARESEAVARVLLAAGADKGAKDRDGDTPAEPGSKVPPDSGGGLAVLGGGGPGAQILGVSWPLEG
jgi:hypothetical protein